MRMISLLVVLLAVSIAGNTQVLPEANLSWQIPTETVGGQPLEVGGFEVIYRHVDDTEWTKLLLTQPDRTSVTIADLDPGEYEAQAAIYDANYCYGGWSDPVHFTIAEQDSPPTMTFSVVQGEEELPDPVDKCDENCTVVSD